MKRPNVCELYLIQEEMDGPIKIGRSISTLGRLKTLQTGNPRPLRVIQIYTLNMDDAAEAETRLHDDLRERRLCGEWFDVTERFITAYMPDFFLADGFKFVVGEVGE